MGLTDEIDCIKVQFHPGLLVYVFFFFDLTKNVHAFLVKCLICASKSLLHTKILGNFYSNDIADICIRPKLYSGENIIFSYMIKTSHILSYEF